MYYGAIEAGGTKFVCAVGNKDGEIIDKTKISTQSPEETINNVINFFKNYPLKGLGIGCFGPVQIDKSQGNYGEILSTPKRKWRNFNIYKKFKNYYDIPVYLDTDVNVAALGEYRWGAAKENNSCLYVTVGTGIGAGFVKDGQTLNGVNHPEMGHIRVKRSKEDDFQGVCPYHSDCLEGLASGPAIEKRYGVKASELSHRDDVWELESYYLAQAVMNYTLILSPHKIILGGGVMKQSHVISKIKGKLEKMVNGYVKIPPEFIVKPKLNDEQGIRGALALALQEKGE
ncbi:ROK family protein [Proteinivorax tanatarense]|uniref:fructokinase n=1 Tax=Proteinivorax tanatarense TaxID=1260629 RepID=A0AAU7VK57_9FIRM